MKARLQTALGQQLVLTPQLRQALHLLQLSAQELDAELAEAVETNPLLEWAEHAPLATPAAPGGDAPAAEATPGGDGAAADEGGTTEAGGDADAWDAAGDPRDDWRQGNGGDGDHDPLLRLTRADSLHEHLHWQLQLGGLGPRDCAIGAALIDAIDDNGYLGESIDAIVEALRPEIVASSGQVLAVLARIQQFDPVGVGARDAAECLRLQLQALPPDTPALALALRLVDGLLERLPRLGVAGIAEALACSAEDAHAALQLLRSLDPHPGARLGGIPHDSYVVPDCVITRQEGLWKVSLAGHRHNHLVIHAGYERMLQYTEGSDATYLRGRLQEARWLLRNLEARADTLLKVTRCLVRQQSGFLEFGPRALRPLTLREVAAEVGLHESTVSRAVSRKYVRTPLGTVALRDFFASGIDTGSGGEASSVAIQQMIRALVDAEDPRKPLSDARLAEQLKAAGVPVARRTVAKYREALQIAPSHERVRLG